MHLGSNPVHVNSIMIILDLVAVHDTAPVEHDVFTLVFKAE